MILTIVGAPALLPEPSGGDDDFADGQEGFELQECGELVVETLLLIRDSRLLVSRGQLRDLVHGLSETGGRPYRADVPAHQASQLAPNRSGFLRSDRSIHDRAD